MRRARHATHAMATYPTEQVVSEHNAKKKHKVKPTAITKSARGLVGGEV